MRITALPFVLVIVAACVGDDPPGGTGSSGSSGSSGSLGSSGASGTSGSIDSGGPDGAGAPRSINCDAKGTCTGTQKCCGVGTDWINASCKDDCSAAYELGCDDAADCGADKVCCFVSDGGARVTKSYCKTACAGVERQLCSTSASAECAAPATCTPFINWAPGGLARCQ